VRVLLEIFVDIHSAVRLNSGKDELRDNLIIRLRGGQDLAVFFASRLLLLIIYYLLYIIYYLLFIVHCSLFFYLLLRL